MSEMIQTGWEPLQLEQWDNDMRAAVEEICRVGHEILKLHRSASERAAAVSVYWKLEPRLEQERKALLELLGGVREVSEKLSAVMVCATSENLTDASDCIDRNIPVVEQAFITIRHAALDLLRWTKRSGHLEDSALPEEYRHSYAALVTYTPKFRPRMLKLLDHLR